MKKFKRINSKIDSMFEIPKEVCQDIPKITSIGFEEMIIENYKGILEYEEYYVRINTSIGILDINGFNLQLEKMTGEDIKITGMIESMELERTNG